MGWISTGLFILGSIVIAVTAIAVISPKVFKDAKTGALPKRSEALLGGIVVAGITFALATWLVPDDVSPANPTANVIPVAANSEAKNGNAPSIQKQVSMDNATPEPSKAYTLSEARTYAQWAYKEVQEAEQALADGIQLQDENGIRKHVMQPLSKRLEHWKVSYDDADQLAHFGYCRDAVKHLNRLASASLKAHDVTGIKQVRAVEIDYQESKKQCEADLAKTDTQILAAVAAEEARIKEQFGGRECLTVFGVNKETGQTEAQPKPEHCKK